MRVLALLLAVALALPAGPVAWADQGHQVLSTGTPSRYDSRDLGLVTPVRLQDPWGDCWVFGSLAAMEVNLVKQGLMSADTHLSTRHTAYFAGTPVGGEAGAQQGEGQHVVDSLEAIYGANAVFAKGGTVLEVASAVSAGEGVVYESAYPYRNNEGIIALTLAGYSADGDWTLPESARFESVFQLSNMMRYPNPGTLEVDGDLDTYAFDADAADVIKQAIVDYGAVTVSYNSQPRYYDENNCTSFAADTTAADHDVCIVGWDDSFPRGAFTTGEGGQLPEEDGAWIVKNSWGAASQEFPNRASWGDDGYFYLSYYDRSAQGFVAWEMMAPDTSITNQHDYLAQRSNSETRVASFSPAAAANVFTVQQTQQLSAVSVNTYAPNTRVAVSLYKLPASGAIADPTDGALLESQELVCAWGGYHRIPLRNEHLLRAGERVAVVVSMVETDAAGNEVPVASIEAGNNPDMVARFGLTHYDTVVCNAGETLVYADADSNPDTPPAWIDGTEFAALLHAQARDGALYGNACIKLFANPVIDPDPDNPPTPSGDPAEPGTPASAARVDTPAQKVSRAKQTARTADSPAVPAVALATLALAGLALSRSRRRMNPPE